MADSPTEISIRLECLQQAVRISEILGDDSPVLDNAKAYYEFVWHGNVPKKDEPDLMRPVPDDEIPF